jgi:hypothetical protein
LPFWHFTRALAYANMAEKEGFERIDKFNAHLKLIIDKFAGYQSYSIIEWMINAMKNTLLPLIVGRARFHSNEEAYNAYAKFDPSNDKVPHWLYINAPRQSGTSTAVGMILAAVMTVADPLDTSFCIIYGTCLRRATFFKEQVLALIPSHWHTLVTLEVAAGTKENIKPCMISIVEDYEFLPDDFWSAMTACRIFPTTYPFLIANSAPGPLFPFILQHTNNLHKLDDNNGFEKLLDYSLVCELHRLKGEQEFCQCNLEPDMIAPWKNTPSAKEQRRGWLSAMFFGEHIEAEKLVD